MKRLLCVVVLLAACAHRPSPRPSLAQFVETEIGKAPFTNALWGVRVEDEAGTVLVDHNSEVLMMPGSNRKIFVSAFAAECLGLDTTLKTELWLDGAVLGSVLNGNVVIRGGGDPSLGGRLENDRDLRMLPFVEALKSRGITRITGSVVADVSMFSREIIPGSWKNDNLGATYAAPIDAIAFNENVVGVRVSGTCAAPTVQADPPFVPAKSDIRCVPPPRSLLAVADAQNAVTVTGTAPEDALRLATLIAIQQPALYAAQALTDVLERHGIEIDSPPRFVAAPQVWREKIVSIESPPMIELLAIVLKPSQNLYSEMLFRTAAWRGEPVDYAAAFGAERAFLTTEVGLDPAQFGFADGCGVSVENMVTPASIVKTLRYFWEPPRREVFSMILATPGESGTLRRRLKGLESRVRGKTGTIDGVSALSGYVIMDDGTPRFFSVLVNNHLSDSDPAEAVLDRLVQRIAER